jgi:hypothetical protein
LLLCIEDDTLDASGIETDGNLKSIAWLFLDVQAFTQDVSPAEKCRADEAIAGTPAIWIRQSPGVIGIVASLGFLSLLNPIHWLVTVLNNATFSRAKLKSPAGWPSIEKRTSSENGGVTTMFRLTTGRRKYLMLLEDDQINRFVTGRCPGAGCVGAQGVHAGSEILTRGQDPPRP